MLTAWLLTSGIIAVLAISPGCGDIKVTPIEQEPTGAASLRIIPAATAVAPGKSLTITVTAAKPDGTPVPDGSVISLQHDSLGTITPTSVPTTGGGGRATFKAGTQAGTATIKASHGDVTKSISVLIDPKAAPGPGPGDAIPISSISFFDSSPAGFKVTATLSHVGVDAPGGTSGPVTVCWDWTHPPWNKYFGKDVTGNMWIIAKIDGRWCAGTWEMMAPKLDNHACRTTEARAGQPPFIQSHGPTAQWYPKSGEQIGHMISTITRNGIPAGSQNERTPIVMTTWP
jgi:hypothetical protein